MSVPWTSASGENLLSARDDAQPALGDFPDLVVSSFDVQRRARGDRVGQAEILAPARQRGNAVGGSHAETIRANPEGFHRGGSHPGQDGM